MIDLFVFYIATYGLALKTLSRINPLHMFHNLNAGRVLLLTFIMLFVGSYA